jgi:hypothetical protein
MFWIVRPVTPIASIVCFTVVGFASKELQELNSTASVSSRDFRPKEQTVNCLKLYAQSSRNQTIRTSLMRYSFHKDLMEIITPAKQTPRRLHCPENAAGQYARHVRNITALCWLVGRLHSANQAHHM